MFKNIGKKIMKLAKVLCGLGIFFSVVGFIVMLVFGIDEDDGLLIGLSFAVLFVGSFGSWIGSFFTYGFGKLIDNSDILVNKGTKGISALKESKEINKENKVSEEIKKESDVKKARLGAKLLVVKKLLAANYDKSKYFIPEEINNGLYITEVYEDSVARGILKPNDIILEFDGSILNDSLDLLQKLEKIEVGSNTIVDLKILRDGNELIVQLTW